MNISTHRNTSIHDVEVRTLGIDKDTHVFSFAMTNDEGTMSVTAFFDNRKDMEAQLKGLAMTILEEV